MTEGAPPELPGGLEDAMASEFIKPQINADERRLVVFAIKCPSNVYSKDEVVIPPQSTQRSQSSAIPAPIYEYKRRHDEEHG